MCGIVSVYSSTGIDPNLHFSEAVHSLAHRGPDEQGTWFCPSGRIALGHTRLSIMDPENGQQPMHSGDVHASVNGEFYGFEEIARGLKRDGAKFRSSSDSEILLHLYRKYGVSALTKLRGEFAFVLWDERAGRVFAARDRFGIKPLYYFSAGDHLVLASEVKAIKALGFQLAWDEENLFNLTAGFVMDPRRTIFKDVYQIPPGHMLLKTLGEERIQEYWNFDYNKVRDEDDLSFSEAQETFETLFTDAVKQRLRADTEVGCYLSGGIDSSAVLAVASEHHSLPIQAFSISFTDEAYDESNAAHEMAQKVNAEFSTISVAENDLADNFADAIWHSEYVFANAHGIAKFLLSDLVRRMNCKVVLTGEGADEALAGYPHFREDLINQCYPEDQKLDLLTELRRSNEASKGLFVDNEFRRIPSLESTIKMTPSFLQVHISAAERGKLVLNGDFYAKFARSDVFDRILSVIDMRPISSAHPVNKSNYLWNKTTFPSYVLTVLADRMEMAHSVEARLPYLDHQLFEFTQTLPMEFKIHDLTEKWILRESMKEKVTARAFETHKHPFTAPPSMLNPKGELFGYIRDTLNSEVARSLPYFEMSRLCGMLDQVQAIPVEQRANMDAVVSMLASLVELKRCFNL